MSSTVRSAARPLLAAILSATCLTAPALTAPALAQQAPIVQPGAPGQSGKQLSADEATRIADTRFSADDTAFMQGMIHHHHQALQMAALVPERTSNQALRDAAKRIDASQEDEIAFMQGWLRSRGQTVPDPAAHAAMGHDMAGHSMDGQMMPGMASAAQMAALAKLDGAAFDTRFLELMIAHHEGAITMVEQLLDQPGSAYDPVLYEFTSDVTNEQRAEIDRMTVLLTGLSDDPRSNLTAGFRDAQEAARHMMLLASLPKPSGFFDANNPAGLPPKKPVKDSPADDAATVDGEEPVEADFGDRSPLLSFANTDMAFSGDLLALGNYHGFNLYRLGDRGMPSLLSSVVCPGGQGDVSIVGDLLIMSVEQTRGRVDCGLQGVSADVSPERFRGLRIFNIADPRRPVQVGQVQTCRGSHTHSVVAADDRALIVYNSGTSGVRDGEELAGCVGDVPGDARTALFRIDVVEIPLADPSKSRIIDSPAVFTDQDSGQIAGLWLGGDHGEGTQETRRTDQCHDITVFPAKGIAAGACSGNGVVFDISDPRKPKRIDAVNDKGFAYWHSATFNNDGTKVLYTDEWGGGARPRCRAQDPREYGADAIYDIVDGKLVYRSHYKLPAAQSDKENCVAHNGAIVPVPGRDIFVQAWYQGGISVIDFTDSANPREIAYFDRGPVDPDHLILGGYWSVYYYNGKIYGSEIARGLDVLALEPSADLTANEIAAAALADQGQTFNPQQQYPVSWPADPVVALAYVDQLQRGSDDPMLEQLASALNAASSTLSAGAPDAALAQRLEVMAGKLAAPATPDPLTQSRQTALMDSVKAIAAKLRS